MQRARSTREIPLRHAVRRGVLSMCHGGAWALSGALLIAPGSQAADAHAIVQASNSRGGPFPPVIVLPTLDGTDGFAVAGAGRAVAIAGDLNGDGLADLVTSSEPLSFVLPGRNTPFPAVIPAS
ncbi:MAG: hypothetical protein AAF184_25875, partial [Pseudomonadota bacterium]